MTKKLVIFGAGDFAELAHYFFTHDSPYEVVAFCVDAQFYRESHLFGIPVVSTEEICAAYPPAAHDVFVALGIGQLNMLREEKCRAMRQLGYSLASFVSSRACVATTVEIRPNTMIMDQAIVYPYSSVGANTIIWTGSIIALKGQVGDNCWILRATFGESVHFGNNSFAGIETAIAPNVRVGAYSILSTRSYVVKDAEEYSVFPPGECKPSKARSPAVAKLFS